MFKDSEFIKKKKYFVCSFVRSFVRPSVTSFVRQLSLIHLSYLTSRPSAHWMEVIRAREFHKAMKAEGWEKERPVDSKASLWFIGLTNAGGQQRFIGLANERYIHRHSLFQPDTCIIYAFAYFMINGEHGWRKCVMNGKIAHYLLWWIGRGDVWPRCPKAGKSIPHFLMMYREVVVYVTSLLVVFEQMVTNAIWHA